MFTVQIEQENEFGKQYGLTVHSPMDLSSLFIATQSVDGFSVTDVLTALEILCNNLVVNDPQWGARAASSTAGSISIRFNPHGEQS